MHLQWGIFPASIGVVAGLLLTFPAHAAEVAPATVQGSGCVEPGVEGSCRILRDLKTKELFNLFFKDKAPTIDTAIAFDGTRTDNPNICMQGKPVNVTKWQVIRLHCPQPEAATEATATDAGIPARCSKWAAWYNVQPGAPKTLHVSGMCTFPDNGYSVSLTKHVPPGINPKVYLLDLTITSPTGKVSHLVRDTPVHFSEQTEIRHESVEILPDHVWVPVQTVQ